MRLDELAEKHQDDADDEPEDRTDEHEQSQPFKPDEPDDEVPRSTEQWEVGPPYLREGKELPAEAPCPSCGELGELQETDEGETTWWYRCRRPMEECDTITFTAPDGIEDDDEKDEEDDFLEDWDEYLDEVDANT